MPGGDFESPSAEEVRRAHTNSDVDGSDRAQHHTLGPRKGQASPGPHSHDGADSVLLLDGVVISGSRSSGAALSSVISALEQLGATNATTA
jgi:hypothetical protein